jgi:chromosome segregation ATPase
MENQYISVKEFAERAGKSVQAIYKGLNNRFNQYVKLVDNQKMIDIRALQEVYGIEVEQPIQPELTTDSTNETVVEVLFEQLKKELDVKNEQLREKDNQIAALNKRLEESHRLLDQSQQLQAMEKKIQALEDKKEDIVEHGAVEPAPESEPEREKKKWWKFW